MPTAQPTLDERSWDEIREQWRKRKFDRLREHVTTLDGPSIGRLDSVIDGTSSDDPDQALREAFTAVSDDAQGPVVVALYVYARCLEMWERSGDYRHIRRMLDALSSEAQMLTSKGSPQSEREADLLRLVVDQAQHMDDAMRVENGVQCSCPVATNEHAGSVAARAERLMERMPPPRADSNGPREVLRSDLAVTGTYFRKVHELSQAVLDLLERDAPASGHFDEVIRSLIEGERAIRGDVYQSELRTHRATAQELNSLARSPWVRIDVAELVYVYPFTLDDDGADAEQVVERARREARDWNLGDDPGVRATSVHETLLSDRWEHADPPERTYGGVTIRLPDIEVETTAKDVVRLEAEVRLSRLGNHHLRIRSELEGATLHDLNQALRRATPGMGEETLTSGGGRWQRFVSPDEDVPGYVQDIIAGIARSLRLANGPEPRVVGDPTADFHVAVAIRELTIENGKRDELPDARDIEEGVAASLLFHSIGDWATSLEEWVRYPTPNVENLMEGSGRAGDLIVRTPDTTVVYMPTSPAWLSNEYLEMIEFVAAMPPVLTAWERRARDRAAEVEAHLTSLQEASADRDTTPESVHGRLEEIRATESGLQQLQAEIQRELADLHSPRLVFDRPSRAFLDRLYGAAGLPSLEADLGRQLQIITTQLERLEVLASGFTAHVEREAEKRQREADARAEERQGRLRRFVELGLALIGVTSVVSLFEWVHSGFDVGGRAWVWLLEGGVLLVAAVVLAVLILREPEGPRKADE